MTDPRDIIPDPAIDVGAILRRVRFEGIDVHEEHTGGGNWVAGIGDRGAYDDTQGMHRHTVNVGPYYRGSSDEPAWVGYAGDIYAVFGDSRPSITATGEHHLADAILSAFTTEEH